MKKYITVSNILACVSFLIALVFVILYAVNVNATGYFKGIKAGGVVLLSILVMVFDLLIIGRSFVKVEGVVAKCCDVCVMVLKVVVPVLLMLAAVNLLAARLDGLGYILFSNVDVKKEVATPENLGSAYLAITAIVFALVGAVEGIVAAFFLPKEKPVEEQAQ